MHTISQNKCIVFLLLVSTILHFLFLSYPSQVGFDEIWFGSYTNYYFSQAYYFDIHPPLGKLLLAGCSGLLGYQGNLDFSAIGQASDGSSLFLLRFLPALLGSFFPLLIYFLLLEVGSSKKIAFLGAFLVLFDNGLFTISKFVLLDFLLLFFGFASLYLFLRHTKCNGLKGMFYLLLSAAMGGGAVGIKWTAVNFMALLLLVSVLIFFKEKIFRKFATRIVTLTLVSFLIYFLPFCLHFYLLPNSGPGDAFHQANFHSLSIWDRFIDLNQKMYFYNAGIIAEHQNSSKWFQWPINKRPIWYWTQSHGDAKADIWLFGNPVIWYLALFSVFFSLMFVVIKKIRQKLPAIFWIFLAGYFVNLLAYVFISRTSFLYHYLPSLVFGVLIFSILYARVIEPALEKSWPRVEKFIYSALLVCVLLVFCVFSPLNYGLIIPRDHKLNLLYSSFLKSIS